MDRLPATVDEYDANSSYALEAPSFLDSGLRRNDDRGGRMNEGAGMRLTQRGAFPSPSANLATSVNELVDIYKNDR